MFVATASMFGFPHSSKTSLPSMIWTAGQLLAACIQVNSCEVLPPVQGTDWPANDLDHFTLAKMKQLNLQPVAKAGKRELIRRATFDRIGLPPHREDVAVFLEDDSPKAFEKLSQQPILYLQRTGNFPRFRPFKKCALTRRQVIVLPTNRLLKHKSGRSGSNRRHAAWEATTLPTELRPQ